MRPVLRPLLAVTTVVATLLAACSGGADEVASTVQTRPIVDATELRVRARWSGTF